MAVNQKAIRQKMKSIGNIKKITKTMEMVSVSKMKKSTQMAYAGRSYAKYALDLLAHISREKDLEHALLAKDVITSKEELVIVIASNKGLAGSYNTNVSKALTLHKNMNADKDIECITIGKQAEKAARRNDMKILASFINFSEKSSSEEFLLIRDMVVEKFKEGKYGKVSILFTELKSAASYKPYLMQLIPVVPELYKNLLLEDEASEFYEGNFGGYTFEPNKTEILNQIIPQIIAAATYHSFVESVASEHSARMFAMKNAGDNAGTLLDDLTLYYNQARQAGITQEISEIVGGASAV